MKPLGRMAPLGGILIVALGAAGFLAYFGQRSLDAAPSRGVEAEERAKRVEAPPALLERVERARTRVEPTVVDGVPVDELTHVDPRLDVEFPTDEEARALREPNVAVNTDVRDRGIDGLLAEPRCVAPSVLTTKGRNGVGGLGCEIEIAPGRTMPVGRYARSLHGGWLEVGEFENGQKTGKWERYYPNGVLESVGSFEGDQRTGVWHEYDDGGRHRALRTYENGAHAGLVVLFSDDEATASIWSAGQELDPDLRVPSGDEFELAERLDP